jgi:uncharacterized membrane protein
MKSLLKYLAQGILVTVPLGITVYILYKIFLFFSGALNKLGLLIHPYVDLLLVFVLIILLLILVGWLASSIFFQWLFRLFEKTMEHVPVIKHIYSPIKDFLGAFVGNKKRFTKPVLVLTNPAAGIEELGFVTQEDLADFGVKEKVAVYVPHSYAFSGRLFIVPRENVKPIKDVSGGDAMKFIVSGGVTDIDGEEKNT